MFGGDLKFEKRPQLNLFVCNGLQTKSVGNQLFNLQLKCGGGRIVAVESKKRTEVNATFVFFFPVLLFKYSNAVRSGYVFTYKVTDSSASWLYIYIYTRV